MCIRLLAMSRQRQAGLSLIEVIVFIIVVGVGITGLLSVFGNFVRTSADPMIQKQVVAIAESLLEEVMLQPFTNCEPAVYDFDAQECPPGGNEIMGPDTIAGVQQSRYALDTPFNNVNDYHGFSMAGSIQAIDGTTIGGLIGYSAAIAVTQVGTQFGIANDEVLRIDVTVTGPNDPAAGITLSGYRFKYAPNP